MARGYSNKTGLPNFLGQHHTLEARRKMRAFRQANPIYNKRLADEHKVNISKSIKIAMGNEKLRERIRQTMTTYRASHPVVPIIHTDEMRHKMSFPGELNPSWRGGIGNEPYPYQFNKKLKEYIRNRDNYICRVCGVPECECDRKLNIHHIDYDKQNLSHTNLISLCNRCNGKVNSNRNYWQFFLSIKIKEEIKA